MLQPGAGFASFREASFDREEGGMAEWLMPTAHAAMRSVRIAAKRGVSPTQASSSNAAALKQGPLPAGAVVAAARHGVVCLQLLCTIPVLLLMVHTIQIRPMVECHEGHVTASTHGVLPALLLHLAKAQCAVCLLCKCCCL